MYEAVRTRRSIRTFRNDAIPRETILRLLEAANLAPSASNRQSWMFLVVDRQALDRMAGLLDGSFKERLAEVGWTAMHEGIKNLPIPVTASNDKVEGLGDFYRTLGGATVAVVVHVKKSANAWVWKNNVCDASAAIENLILAAWSEGLGTCWMTGPLMKREPEIKAFLGLPEEREIVGIIPVGVPAEVPPSPPKRDVGSRVAWFGE